MKTTSVLKDQPCPFCSTKFKSFDGNGEGKIVPGIVLFCTSCSGVCTLNEEYKVVPMTQEQFNAFPPKDREFILAAVAKTQRKLTSWVKQFSPDAQSIGALGKSYKCPSCGFETEYGVSAAAQVNMTPGTVFLCPECANFGKVGTNGELVEFTKEEFDALPQAIQMHFLSHQLYLRNMNKTRS